MAKTHFLLPTLMLFSCWHLQTRIAMLSRYAESANPGMAQSLEKLELGSDAAASKSSSGEPPRRGGGASPRIAGSVGRGGLEPDLPVRRLATALAVAACRLFFLEHLDRRGRDSFVDVATAQARAELTVPVAFGDHGATASLAAPGQDGLHYHGLPPPTERHRMKALRLPPGLADGFGL